MTAEPASPSPQPRRTGRLIVYTVFWSVVLYVPIAVLASVWVSLYGAVPADAAQQREQRGWCVRAIVGLRDELDAEVLRSLSAPKRKVEPTERFRAWDADFTHRMEDAAHRCGRTLGGRVETAFQQLASLHTSYAEGIESILQARADVSPGLGEVVRDLSAQGEAR